MDKLILILFTVFFNSVLLFSAPYPSIEEKLRVREILQQVEAASGAANDLDEVGRSTMKQASDILSIGPSAVYALSAGLRTDDWKVRFWIVDILGYLNNIDAQRPLLRVLQDEREFEAVKRQAVRSLQRLKVPVPEGYGDKKSAAR